jgi:hypothetical protein
LILFRITIEEWLKAVFWSGNSSDFSGRFLPERTGLWSEDTGKIRRFSGPEYRFHASVGTDRFLVVLSDLGFRINVRRSILSGYETSKKFLLEKSSKINQLKEEYLSISNSMLSSKT